MNQLNLKKINTFIISCLHHYCCNYNDSKYWRHTSFKWNIIKSDY